MLFKREVKSIPYAGYQIDSYVVLDENDKYIIPVCDFLLDTAIKGSPANTIRNYASDLIAFFSILQSVEKVANIFPSDFRDITASDLDAYLIGNLFQKKRLNGSTVLRHASTINLFYQFAYQNDYISFRLKWEHYKKLPVETTLINKTLSQVGCHFIELETFEKILLPNIVAKSSFKRARDELALKLGYYAGLRTHELVKHDNFTLKRMKALIPLDSSVLLTQHLTIKGKGGKVRRLPVSPDLVVAIHDFMYGTHKDKLKFCIFEDGTGQALTDEQYGSDVFFRAISKYLSSNTVDSEVANALELLSYHSLRHTFATNAVTFCHDIDSKYSPRWAVTQWMGHANERTTEIYICYEALKNNRIGVIDEMKLSDIHFPTSFAE